jgi:hypothetical protein
LEKLKKTIKDPTEETASEFNITGIILNEKANGTLITVKSNKRIPSYLQRI